MEQKDIEQASDIILNSIMTSDLEPQIKIELLVNMRLFFENYNENIMILNQEKRKNDRFNK